MTDDRPVPTLCFYRLQHGVYICVLLPYTSIRVTDYRPLPIYVHFYLILLYM